LDEEGLELKEGKFLRWKAGGYGHAKQMRSAGIPHIRGISPQLTDAQRWYALARYICEKVLAVVPHTPTSVAVASGREGNRGN